MAGGKILFVVGLAAILVVGTWYSLGAAQPVQSFSEQRQALTYQDFFSSLSLFVFPLIIAVAVAFGSLEGYLKRKGLDVGKVERHRTSGIFLEHWTNMVGFLVLIITGIFLGGEFVFPALLTSPFDRGFAYNLHFVGVGLVLFAITYYLTNHILAGERSILPSSGAFGEAMKEYRWMLGGGQPVESGRYFATQQLAFLVWVVLIVVMGVTGFIKMNIWPVPGYLFGLATTIHDIFFILFGIYLIIHVVLILLPANRPLLKSLVTGHISLTYVREHNALWYKEMAGKK